MTESHNSHAGSVLVSTPIIAEPPFARTVVALIEHDHEGALGLILNLPSDLSVERFLPEISGQEVDPGVIFVGGPVGTDSALGLLRSTSSVTIRPSPFSGVSIVDPTDPGIAKAPIRVFAGFSGWSPGQLEAEIEEGAWWTALAHIEDFFTPTPESLWDRTIRRVSGRAPLYATFPDDIQTN